MAQRVRITGPARRDIDLILRRSREDFGAKARQRYRALIDKTLKDLGSDPARPGVKAADDIRAGYFLSHLKWSRPATSIMVKKPRHIVVFYIYETDAVVIARVFHERQMLSKHLIDNQVE